MLSLTLTSIFCTIQHVNQNSPHSLTRCLKHYSLGHKDMLCSVYHCQVAPQATIKPTTHHKEITVTMNWSEHVLSTPVCQWIQKPGGQYTCFVFSRSWVQVLVCRLAKWWRILCSSLVPPSKYLDVHQTRQQTLPFQS